MEEKVCWGRIWGALQAIPTKAEIVPKSAIKQGEQRT